MLAATFDIGTTAVKAVVVNENGEPVFTGSSVIHTIETGNFKEQDPDEWYGAFCKLSKEMFEIIPPKEIRAVIFSGQMQDVISVGAEGKALRNAILYSDGRADEQARTIIREAASRNVVPLGDAYIAEITGNHFDGSMPLAKILWLKENEPEIYEKTACFLISSKDYIIGRLTSVFAGDMTACSTAAGPALEGAKIKFGMRGAPGAIDHVWVEDGKIRCSVIGGGEAKGICGSGLIDAVASLLELGLLNARGRLQAPDGLDGERIVRLTDTVYITQNDIREVQMAKGAIAAGISLMARELGIGISQIDKVLLAGAFGSFLKPESACRIGLLPAELLEKITAVGNAAGSGAKMMVCSKDEFTRTDELISHIEFIELASLPDFQRKFAKNMRF